MWHPQRCVVSTLNLTFLSCGVMLGDAGREEAFLPLSAWNPLPHTHTHTYTHTHTHTHIHPRELSCTPAHIYLPGCATAFLEPHKRRKVRHSCRSGHPKRNEKVWKEIRKGTDLGEVQCHVICSLDGHSTQLRDSTAVVAAQQKRLTKPTPTARAAALPGAQRVSSTSEHPLNEQ